MTGKDIQAAAEGLNAAVAIAFPRLEEAYSRFLSQDVLGDMNARLQEQLQRLCFEIPAEVRAAMERVPVEMRRAVRVLGQRGWYIEMDMPVTLPPELADWLENDYPAAVDWLVGYYRGRAPAIIEDVATRFAARRRVLQLAFEAHGRGEYELSVPIFLIQADGLCIQLIGVSLYRERATSKYIEQLPADRLTRALHEPLVGSPISAPYDPPWSGEHLNRHAVLHGAATDYGTEVNSLKAISLLQYVATVVGEAPADQDK